MNIVKRDRRKYYRDNVGRFKLNSSKRYKNKTSDILKYNSERYYDYNNYPKYVLWRAKKRARTKGLEFNIDLTDIKIPKICPILKVVLKRCIGSKKRHSPNSPSLDRIDSTKGYIKGNVQIISQKANVMKSNASAKELLMFANYIIKNYGVS